MENVSIWFLATMPKAMRVCLTGGGTAGHVTPHFALLPLFRQKNYEIFYVGSSGIESELVAGQGVSFHTIPVGKLRRYVSLQNFFDIFKVILGIFVAVSILVRCRPSVVFSKGGFVSVPVAVAAWLLRIPVVSHESDMTPGLATKIVAKFAKKILYTFPETGAYLPKNAENVGTPIRPELFTGDKKKGETLCGFGSETIPTVLIMGGSQGAAKINAALESALPELVKRMRIIHLTGKGKLLSFQHARYHGVEYANEELKDLLAVADVVISRAGANSIFELLALRKPMLLIPLVVGSRGDQILNAESFVSKGWAASLDETKMTDASFLAAIDQLLREQESMELAQSEFVGANSADHILRILESYGLQKG